VTPRSYYVRNMLLSYDKQLITARRLARYRRLMRPDGADAVSISVEAKRHQLVERVAKEVVENLLISGSDNPVVQRIRAQLEAECKQRYFFEYPVSAQELRVLKETKDGPLEVGPDEKMEVLNRLWKITLDTVDETML
jgi:hypothetical protein